MAIFEKSLSDLVLLTKNTFPLGLQKHSGNVFFIVYFPGNKTESVVFYDSICIPVVNNI